MKSILFVGMYPNSVSPYRNVFFQNLIFAIADAGVKCTVISPVPITKYFGKTKQIPKCERQYTLSNTELTVYYPRYVSASSIKIAGYNTEKISEKLFSNAALKVAQKLKRNNKQFDCVYGHFFLYGGLAAMRVGRKLNIPSFLAYGECDFNSQVGKTYGYPKENELLGLTGIISVSMKNTKELYELGIVHGVPIITAPNATDLTLFKKKDKTSCRERLGIPQDKFVVGFVGGFIERKGDKRLLEAINKINGVYVAYAGRGDNPPTGAKVVFCKALKHEEVSYFLNAIDVFCLPTLSEGSCNAIVEAMACGCPIVSSNLPFNDDALNNMNSILIDPMSVDEIRDAISKLYDNTDFRKQLSNRSLETAINFGIVERAKKIIGFIDEQLKQ